MGVVKTRRRLAPGFRRWVGPALAIGCGLIATPALAQVLDIAPDGAMTVIAGPSVQYSADPSTARLIVRSQPPAQKLAGPARAESPEAVRSAIRSAADYTGLDSRLIEAVAWQESRFRPQARSPKGAVGVMQLMPGTARDLGVRAEDLEANVRGGALYLRQMMVRYDSNLTLALAAYNAGPGAVDRHRGLPPYRETRAYVEAILEHLAEGIASSPEAPVRSPSKVRQSQ